MRQQTYRGTGLLIMFMLIMACVWLVMPQRNQDQLTNQQFMQVLEDGNIQEYTDVVDIFEIYEIRQMAEKSMELSGVSGKNKIEVIEESLKN